MSGKEAVNHTTDDDPRRARGLGPPRARGLGPRAPAAKTQGREGGRAIDLASLSQARYQSVASGQEHFEDSIFERARA